MFGEVLEMTRSHLRAVISIRFSQCPTAHTSLELLIVQTDFTGTTEAEAVSNSSDASLFAIHRLGCKVGEIRYVT